MTQETLKLALEALAVRFSEGWHEGIKIDASDIMLLNKAAQALAQPCDMGAICIGCTPRNPDGSCPGAQPKQEPMADDFFRMIADRNPKPFPPPQRTWVGLTDDEIDAIYTGVRAVHREIDSDVFARAIEAKLKQKNGYAEEKNT